MGIVMRTVGLLVGTGLGGIACVGAGAASEAGTADGTGLLGAVDADPDVSRFARGPLLSHAAAQGAPSERRAIASSKRARFMARF
jgi:hypothetical protein